MTFPHARVILSNSADEAAMAIDPEDLEPKKQKPKPRDLEGLSVSELQDYIADLEAEIARAKAAIARKQDHRSGAEAFFKKR